MKRAFAVFNRLFHPPKWALLLVPPIVFTALAYIFLTGQNNSVPAYPVYGMSAYCLITLILPTAKLIRRFKASVMRRLNRTAFYVKYVSDLAFRGSVSICASMLINFLYVAFRFAVGIRYKSTWFISMAVYYLVLGILRLSLVLSYHHRDRISQTDCYRRTAWLLFLLNIPMGGMILLMVLTDSGYSYPGYIIYISAIYTFYTIAASIVNLVKYKRLGSPILSAARVLNLIAALMSVLGLQTAMISQFSEHNESFRRLMNTITGGGVWGAVILIAVCMLYKSKKLKDEVKPVE